MEKLFNKIIVTYVGSEVCEKVDAVKHEYVHDWEDDFDDIHEAYEEQGRGEAESQVIQELINSCSEDYGTFDTDDLVDLMNKLADHYELTLN